MFSPLKARSIRFVGPALGIVVSAAFLGLAFRTADVGAIVQQLASTNVLLFMLALLFTMLALFLVSLRWRYLLEHLKQVSVGRAFAIVGIGYMINYTIPGRPGELARSYLMGTTEGISRTATLATVVVEKVIDGFILAALLQVTLRLLPFPEFTYWAGQVWAVLFLSAGAVLTVIRLRQDALQNLADLHMFQRYPRLVRRALRALGTFSSGVRGLGADLRTAKIILLSLLFWGSNAVSTYLLLLAVGLTISINAAVALLIGLSLATVIPSAPGYIGTNQFIAVSILGVFGVLSDEALAFALLFQAAVVAGTVLVGLAGLNRERTSLGRILTSTKNKG